MTRCLLCLRDTQSIMPSTIMADDHVMIFWSCILRSHNVSFPERLTREQLTALRSNLWIKSISSLQRSAMEVYPVKLESHYRRRRMCSPWGSEASRRAGEWGDLHVDCCNATFQDACFQMMTSCFRAHIVTERDFFFRIFY